MPHYKITYRPLQGGWVVFDADRTTPQARMNGDSLPVVFVGGPDHVILSVERCHAWIALRSMRPELPLRVERGEGCHYWWVVDASRPFASTKTKADAMALRKFILAELATLPAETEPTP